MTSAIFSDLNECTDYISTALIQILNSDILADGVCSVIQNRQLYWHSLNTAKYSIQIALSLDENIDLVELAKASLLHDIGKTKIPSDILDKPGKLTEAEFSVMKTHSKIGWEILKQAEMSSDICNTALWHHEKLDGSGYPDGLTEVSLFAQIVAVADIFSALTEVRVYKPPIEAVKALEILRSTNGIRQDFVDILEQKIIPSTSTTEAA